MATLHLIGTGTPTPTKDRHGTCHVLETDGEYLMFDCGPASTHKLVKAGLWPTKIEHLFFTHHHFDHNVDYPCFLLCRWDQSTGKEKPLKVFGPPPTRLITDRLIGPEGAFNFDLQARINHPVSQSVHKNRGGSLPRPGCNTQVTDVGAGAVVATDRWSVTAGLVRHMEPWLNSLAYRVQCGQWSIVFAGDTEPCETLTRFAAKCDVIVTNCWDTQDKMDANGEGPSQTGTRDAARLAKDSGAKMLILTHTGPRLCTPTIRQQGLDDIASIYSGKVVFGEEMMAVRLD